MLGAVKKESCVLCNSGSQAITRMDTKKLAREYVYTANSL